MRKMVLVVLAAACLLAAWSFAPAAQVIEGDGCVQACFEQKAECVSACGEHSNPMECESECREQLEDCQRQC